MSRQPFTFYEFFAGGGMARLGLGERWRCLFANDFDPVKARAYRDNFGDDHFREGDVFDLIAADLPGRADLAWASSPCQDFSLAGARAGLAGGRSSAFFGFWRLVQALNAEGRAPRVIVVENVVGLLTSHGGRDFEALCRALAGAGYGFGALEADAADFLPQSRPRVLIIAARETPPAGRPAEDESRAVRNARERLPADLRARWVGWSAPRPPRPNVDLAGLLEPDEAVDWRTPAQTRHLLGLMDDAHRGKLELAASRAERTVGAYFRRTRGSGQRAEVRFDGMAGCLRTPRGGSSRQGLIVAQDGQVRSRLITPREAARLMGLPETYGLPAGTTAALHLVGDGVAVPLVRHLAEHILEPLLKRPTTAIAAE
ncbi:MAG: DNA cytosine methyltransferase [Caulobacterales bacterium]